MDRKRWLAEIRGSIERRYDTLFAPIYDANWGSEISETHRLFLERLLRRCPPDGILLDAACGTGKYWPLIINNGRSVFGIDQSAGMLAVATEKHPQVPIARVGLQELAFIEVFHGAICIDAMEFVFPEDWPRVLVNLHRALRPRGALYMTVEQTTETELREAYNQAQSKGWPVVFGESVVEGGGYHYYPSDAQVEEWISQAGFWVLERGVGDGYQHFIIQRKEMPM